MAAQSVPSSLKANAYIRIVENVVICDGPGRRHRAFPTGARLPNGDVLVGYRVARDHWMTADDAFYTSRSPDNGKTWGAPVAVAALPGWGVNGVIGQYPNGVMPPEEKELRAALQLYRWEENMPLDKTWRENPAYWIFSKDYGDTWGKLQLVHDTIAEVKTDRGRKKFWGLWLHSNESTIHRLADGRLMGMFVGRADLAVYNPNSTHKGGSDTPMAGFSNDNGMTWTFRTVADPEGEIGFSESDSVRLPNGRFVAIYGNNAGSPWFFETHSDNEGQTWSPMRQLNFRGDSPSMIRLSSGALIAAIRSIPEDGKGGIGLVASANEGQTWELLGNLHDQANWDMGYPDLIKLADGRILCVYYTGNERLPIPKELEDELTAKEPIRSIFEGGIRPAAFEEIQSEIRAAILEEPGQGVEDLPRGAPDASSFDQETESTGDDKKVGL
jgi:hypothetical protein